MDLAARDIALELKAPRGGIVPLKPPTAMTGSSVANSWPTVARRSPSWPQSEPSMAPRTLARRSFSEKGFSNSAMSSSKIEPSTGCA